MVKLLIIRFSSIGDIVLTTPVIRCLKKQLNNCEIHYLTKDSYKNILHNNPYLDKVFSFKQNMSEILDLLKSEDYDYIVDLHNNLRSKIVKSKLSAKSFSLNKINIEKWLIVNLKINKLPNIHIVDRYLETIQSLGVINDEEGLDFFIENPAKEIENIIPCINSGFIAFVIGGQHRTKCLPNDKIVSICNGIKLPVVLLGGNDDSENASYICKKLNVVYYNACGKLSLNDSAYVVSQSTKVVSHDTGLMHIAAAFNKDIISIWGNTVPEFGMYPYLKEVNKSKIFEIKNLKCRPCSKIGYKECPKKHFNCMNQLDENEIIIEINR